MAERRSASRALTIPEPLDVARRESYEHDLTGFLLTYMPSAFPLPFSDDHGRVLAKVQSAILTGGLFAEAMPRGSGKTTIVEGAVLWAILYGHRHFVVPIASDKDAAVELLTSIKTELDSNELLGEDFPEVCVPVSDLEGRSQRCHTQTHDGELIGMVWRIDKMVFPTVAVPWTRSTGAIIMPLGLTGRLRGPRHKLKDGSVSRPDFVILDDPQTDESAYSEGQCDARERLIKGAVLGMSGPGKKIAAVMPCTVIRKGDLADRLLDHKRHPEWQGERTQLITTWPDAQDTLWQEYGDIWRESMANGDGLAPATTFYLDHREAMDAGAILPWEHRKQDHELSALQHAENLILERGMAIFMAEYQNAPEDAKPALYDITADVVCSKLNGLPHRHVPPNANYVTVMIDVNPSAGLNWCCAAWGGDMTGYVLDYGIYPGENKPLWTAKQTGGLSEDQAIFQGLAALVPMIVNDTVFLQNNEPRKPDIVIIDCGYKMDTVFSYTRTAQLGMPVVPGRGWGTKTRAYTPPRGAVRVGNNWHVTDWQKKGRVLVHAANFWRMTTQKAFLLQAGGPGSVSLWGKDGRRHRRFGREVSAERLVEFVRGDAFDHYVWFLTPGEANDLLDCIVGCAVGASWAGGKLAGEPGAPRKVTKRKKAKAKVAYF